MNWQELYTTRRTGDPEQKQHNPDQVRNSYLRDYDRLIFASAFRRLQNKTQVFPLPGSVFVHNRMTHSLEVASVGRSLGKKIGDIIADRHPNESKSFTEFYRYELSSVIAAACLAHDIGNPPFGHSGEDAIRTFFNEAKPEIKQQMGDQLSSNQIKDFELFEGNANALRTLTHSFNEIDPGGYKLTYTTLASLVKYPCSSEVGFDKSTGLIATKKSGFFDSEINTYKSIASSMGIPAISAFNHVYARHPFVFLTEAADDICYRIIDLEDAHRLRIISFEKFCQLFLPFFDEESGYNSMDYVQQKLDRIVDDNQKIQFIRAKWIGLMVEKISRAFVENEVAILKGELNKDLLSCLNAKDAELINAINQFSIAHIYNHRSVVEIEIAGYHVIGGLLQEFISAALHPKESKSAKLLKLIPAQFPFKGKENTLYEDLQSVVDYIAGMTDLYAIDLYRKITGISAQTLTL